jgi:ABC-2 type transport system permease protein
LNKREKKIYSSILSILFLAVILIFSNKIIEKFNIQKDLTSQKLYSLNKETIKILKMLEKNINIYVLNEKKNLSNIEKNLLDQYQIYSRKINLKFISEEESVRFGEKFKTQEQISRGSIIIESGEKFKIIDYDDLYTSEYSMFGSEVIKSIDIEPQITNAIRYLMSGKTPIIYELVGHNETKIGNNFKKQIKLANFEIKNLNLIIDQKIPSDCEILIITTLERDLTLKESELIKNYLLNNGSLLIANGINNTKLVNLNSIFKNLGFEFDNKLILENKKSNYIAQGNAYLLPEYVTDDITKTLSEKKYNILMPICQNIIIINQENQNNNIKKLLVSSNNSYAKKDLDFKTLSKEKNDLSGPFNLAIKYENEKTKIIAIGCGEILNDTVASSMPGSNQDFIINSLNFLNNNKDNNLYIPSKTKETEFITFKQNHAIFINIFSIIIFPLMFFLSGLYIINLRKKY